MEAAKPKGRADCRLSIGAAVELLKTAGQLPAGLEQCDAFDLDRHSPDLPVLGAPNGVIDLNTGQLLPREEGRKRFVSRSIPDEFQPDAQHKMVDDLIAHVPEAEREYLLAAVGFALRRIPGPAYVPSGGEEAQRQDNAPQCRLRLLGRREEQRVRYESGRTRTWPRRAGIRQTPTVEDCSAYRTLPLP